MIRKMHLPIGKANGENSLVKKRRSSNHKRERRKLTSKQNRIAISIVVHFRLGDMAEATASRFVSFDDTIESFIEEHENPNALKKNRDVALLTVFLQTKGETREIAEILPVELNELLS